MICKNCGKEILRGKFCPKCGTKVPEKAPPPAQMDNLCSSCNAQLNPGAKFCRACGAPNETSPPVIPENPTMAKPVNPPVSEPKLVEPEKEQVFPIAAESVQPDMTKDVEIIPEIAPAEPQPPLIQEETTPAAPENQLVNETNPVEPEREQPVPEPIPVMPKNPPAQKAEPAKYQSFSSPIPESGTPDKKKPVLPIVIAAILLLVAAVGAWLFLRPHEISTASLHVKTDPGNVYINLDGQQIGQTDDSGELFYENIAPGLHEVLAHLDNYAAAKQNFQFISGEQLTAELVLVPLVEPPSSLLITTNPGNAQIMLDGKPIGMTDYSGNLMYEDVAPGQHEILARRENYSDAKQNLLFTSGELQTAQLILNRIADVISPKPDSKPEPKPGTKPDSKPEPKPETKPKENIPSSPTKVSPKTSPAGLLVKTDPGNVYITLDGQEIGQTDDSGNLLYEGIAPGRHEVFAFVDGYTDAKQELLFTSGEQQVALLLLDRLTGRLTINVNASDAQIRIRGQGVLETYIGDQVTDMEFPAGSYTVTVSKSGYRSVTRTVNVRANANERVSVAMEATYTGPNTGMMVWEGDVRGSTMVTIENGKASTGRVTGNPLPGVPCSIQLSDPRNAAIAYAPGPESDYKRVVLQVNSKGRMRVTLRWTVLR